MASATIISPFLLHRISNLPVSLASPTKNHRVSSGKSTYVVKNLARTSYSEGIPVELIEDSKFVPLKPDDPTYGPPALLLLGFEHKEAVKIINFLKHMNGEFLKVIYCTEAMIDHPLSEAMDTKQSDLEAVKIAESLPRICFFSGLSGEEMTMFIDAFPETGLEGVVFAAMVPNSANKLLRELIDEVMGDHEMLVSSSFP